METNTPYPVMPMLGITDIVSNIVALLRKVSLQGYESYILVWCGAVGFNIVYVGNMSTNFM